MSEKLIDFWDIETFDEALLAKLHAKGNLIQDNMVTDKKHFLAREASDRTEPYPSNPYAGAYYHFVEHVIMPAMENHSIRAWHYTHLTDVEAELLRSGASMSQRCNPSGDVSMR